MKYCSTRGGVSGLTFTDALLMGLASDGGLLVPEQIPDVRDNLASWRDLSFVELAQEIIALFVDDIERKDLDELIRAAYMSFDHPEVIGTKQLDAIKVVELFHGPTLAFKDVALQLLGQLFTYVLNARGQRLNILGATSGDTGSAAIAGVRGQHNIDIFILYPRGRVSPMQELQMTTVADSNVHCVAVDGSFDDCQNLMKAVFADLDFKQQYQLGAVNSVNWARVLAQIVYYGFASLRQHKESVFAVPTGNFGNVFAAYLAYKMGFPIQQLIVATNENDILARFYATGDYSRGESKKTISPAMDIQIASNFERFLFYYLDRDATKLAQMMATFNTTGRCSIGAPPTDGIFKAYAVTEAETRSALHEVYSEHDYILDPHTAVGYVAAQRSLAAAAANAGQGHGDTETVMTVMATAHPAKFPETVHESIGTTPTHPSLEALRDKPTRSGALPAELDAVKAYLIERISA
ncbi:MAG TPA: threonine synthase [Gammaproteobacteria bacterium]|nr:threonine synthase [Gammaproteobacteria bacterium]